MIRLFYYVELHCVHVNAWTVRHRSFVFGSLSFLFDSLDECATITFPDDSKHKMRLTDMA